ncbi:MAG: permease [Bacteroidetes bacterium MedPE-SWsnd-G1]|nr:MAG: permease [Bacteroidetes bacterium MedPE-SWsnd-G1]
MLKKYLGSFFFVLIILIPVIIAVDISEKIDKFLRHTDLTIGSIITDYYVNFIINIGNMILPLALFISVLFFTSKLAGNTEIIAINNAKISFTRFLKPYFIGATIVTLLALGLNHFIVPNSSKIFTEFSNTYIKNKRVNLKQVNNVNLQLSENEYIFIRSFGMERNNGSDFSYERYEGNMLKERLLADRVIYRENDSTYRLNNFYKRKLHEDGDVLEYGRRMDTIFNFEPSDLLYVESLAKEMQTPMLLEYIAKSKSRGRGNLNSYLVELHKRTSLPLASYILTLIAVTLGAVKRRGGIGINLTIGVSLMFVYVFMLKIVEVLGASADASPLFLVWFPNMIFGALAIYLYINARK